jgi:hypothetical protein
MYYQRLIVEVRCHCGWQLSDSLLIEPWWIAQHEGRMTKAVLLAGVLVLFPLTAYAVDLPVELSAAQMTARSGSRNLFKIEDVHQRMQSAINCLVGPKGEGFDAAAPNPCAASGNGVIPDTTDPAKKAKFQEAVEKLKSGLTVADRKDAMQIALDGADLIVAAAGD